MAEIIVGIDGSDNALHAAAWATYEAAQRSLPVRLVTCYHITTYGDVGMGGVPIDVEAVSLLRERAQEDLATAADHVRALDPTVAVSTTDIHGAAQFELTNVCTADDILVVGSRGTTGFFKDLVGSVATAVSHRAPCPVMVIPPSAKVPSPDQRLRVVVGVDGSECAAQAMRWAYDEAHRSGGTLVLAHAWSYTYIGSVHGMPVVSSDDIRSDADGLLQSVRDSLVAAHDGEPAGPIETVLANDSPRHLLTQLSSEADLVVVGSHGHSGLAGVLLGSVSRGVVEHAHCAVTVLRETRS